MAKYEKRNNFRVSASVPLVCLNSIQHLDIDLIFVMVTTMKRSPSVQTILVRLPLDVQQWLKEQCAHNLTSYSSQLTLILRDKMSDQERARA